MTLRLICYDGRIIDVCNKTVRSCVRYAKSSWYGYQPVDRIKTITALDEDKNEVMTVNYKRDFTNFAKLDNFLKRYEEKNKA